VAVHYRSCAGGGYGSPRDRDPARVLADLNSRWLSPEKARAVFGVVAKLGANGVDYELDAAATAKLRTKSKARSAKAKSGNRRRK
jgi:N-methylhydantoinase B